MTPKRKNSKLHISIITGSKLYIRFFTDGIRSKKYFKASFYTRTSVCGGLIRGSKGSIRSPNYPLAYRDRMSCDWTIITEDTFHLAMHFEAFDLSPNCDQQSIEIQDLVQKHTLKTVCKKEDLENISFSNQVKIIYRNNINGNNYTGFSLRYKKQCGMDDQFEGSNKFIRASVLEEFCEWNLKAIEPKGRVTFTPLRIECECGRLDRKTCSDTKGVTIYEGSVIRASFCDSHPHQITSNGQSLRIVSKNVAFRGTYSSFDNTCGGILTSVSGSFASPLYPNSYPLNSECEWSIVAESGNFIELNFIRMDIFSSDDCNSDYLEIRQSDKTGKLLGLFCSKELPNTLRVFEKVWVKFKSGDSSTATGFLINYNYAYNNEISGKEKGSILSPNINSIRNRDVPFTWRVMVPLRNYITLDFQEYNMGLEVCMRHKILEEVLKIVCNLEFSNIFSRKLKLYLFNI